MFTKLYYQGFGLKIRFKLSTISLLCVLSVLCGSISAQVQPIYDRGAMGLGQMLKRLNNTKRVMHIAAHPDDEDSGLLAYLARGENARTVYLSLTRGDGGQNVIGPELFEPLGIIRTEELLQARTLDGAEQLFTRAFDFGFSKTLAETRAKWDEEKVKCDVVRAIRSFRPQVVISRFSGTPNDGHGHHQFSGYLTPIAIEAAADKNQCKDAGMPWQVLKFYVGQSFRSREEPQLKINTGKYDSLLGRSYFEIAAEGRSQHKSQEQGFLELKGDRFSGVNLVWSKVKKVENETSIFAGIDTSIEALGRQKTANSKNYLSESEIKILGKISKLFEKAEQIYKPNNSAELLPLLAQSQSSFSKLFETLGKKSERNVDVEDILFEKFIELSAAVQKAAGIQIDSIANTETVVPGEEFSVAVKVFHPQNPNLLFKEIDLLQKSFQPAWEISESEEAKDTSRFARFFRENPRHSKNYTVKVPSGEAYSQPHFLKNARSGYMYSDYRAVEIGSACPECRPVDSNAPFLFDIPMARVKFTILGKDFVFLQPIQYRERDQIRGELRRSLNVVPKVSVKMERDLVVSPRQKEPSKHNLSVSLVSNSQKEISGKLYLKLPNGQKIKMTPPKEKNLRGDDWFYEVKNWKVSPESSDFSLKRKGESVSYDFEIEVPPFEQRSNYEIEAIAEIDGEKFTQTLNKVAYDHIQTHRYYTEAKTNVRVLDLEVADVKVGYIEGTGDRVPALIRQLGVDVEFLDKKFLTNGDFSKFDLIVVGIRASEARPDYIANNKRLLEYVKNGGTMIVQYQKWAYQRLNLAPFPFSYNARVAEEDAKITILEPNHPVFNFPNKITQDDFLDWVQERNLYAFRTFDERYTPLLEAHDTGEPDNKGGMVYAEIGKGKYMYVSYAFFRQLPAGVPGAYRLYANILSLPKAKKETVAE